MVSSEIPAFSDDVTGDSQHTDDTIKKWLNVCGVLPWGKKMAMNKALHVLWLTSTGEA